MWQAWVLQGVVLTLLAPIAFGMARDWGSVDFRLARPSVQVAGMVLLLSGAASFIAAAWVAPWSS